MPRHIVCLTFDFDTQSGFIARGMTTPTPLSRGEFGGRVACNRILKFLAERNIKATWFTPGFTIESWPKECAAVVEGGHEIGAIWAAAEIDEAWQVEQWGEDAEAAARSVRRADDFATAGAFCALSQG